MTMGSIPIHFGNTRSVLNEEHEDQTRDVNSLVKVLNMRYGSVERSEMYRAQLKYIIKKESDVRFRTIYKETRLQISFFWMPLH